VKGIKKLLLFLHRRERIVREELEKMKKKRKIFYF